MKETLKKIKVLTVLGTRPEIIRLACILPALDTFLDHKIVFTSQSYDFELSNIFFEELQLRKPDYILSVKANTIGQQIGNILTQTEEIMHKERPDALFVLGDTNSALCTIIAKRLKIPIFHMEAGNRSFDWNVPEEINRRLVDHISDYNIAYTEHSRRYLIQEGVMPETVFVVGSPLPEVFQKYKKEVEQSKVLQQLKLKKNAYFLVSTHREENVDKLENLQELFDTLDYLAEIYKFPIIVSLHPRTKKRIEEAKIHVHSLVKFNKPFGYFAYNALQKNAFCVLSDSGSIQEEAAILKFPAVQVRVSTERPEAFDAGSIVVAGFNKNAVANAISLAITNHNISIPTDYTSTNVADKVVRIILGLTSIMKYNKRKYGR